MKASPWDGKIKDFKLEPASFSQMVHTVVPGAGAGGQTRSPWRLDDRDPALPDFPSDDIHSHVLWWHCPALASDPLLQYFLPRLKLPVFGTQPETWPEKTWENITRVFTRGEKAGQTNHLNLYCSTFLWQALYLYNVSTQYSRVHIFFLFALLDIQETRTHLLIHFFCQVLTRVMLTSYQAQWRVPGGHLVIIDDLLSGRIPSFLAAVQN